MRKPLWILLFGILALALSSCILVLDLPVSNFRFDSNWYYDDYGTTKYAFCSNRPTQMRYKFRAPDSSVIASIRERYVGSVSGDTLNLNRPITQLSRDGNDLVFVGTLTFGEGDVPQSLPGGVSQQAIVVTPVPNPSITGYTTVTVTVTTTSGFSYSGSYKYAVFSNCP